MSQGSPILAAHPDAAAIARHESALSRWDNEGGAIARPAIRLPADIPELTNAELVHLRIRVIALENLLIAMLACAPDGQLGLARAMAAHIAPRPGSTHHPLTEHAAQRMRDLLVRARHYTDTDIP
ncbi:hypothetical protein FHW96_002634 [Novosphingobium sp. SG751A]|uniref:hypothetical protein n=1 Tax=Novosphingobium sp. SG751A TaxID=2587000 RepID=UPI001557955E|nr:hypothetical protein [Novosphingobium sp. SG751A]NOW46474.1 hypothetical protein [Novosphingobium sp. SG751A]